MQSLLPVMSAAFEANSTRVVAFMFRSHTTMLPNPIWPCFMLVTLPYKVHFDCMLFVLDSFKICSILKKYKDPCSNMSRYSRAVWMKM